MAGSRQRRLQRGGLRISIEEIHTKTERENHVVDIMKVN